MNIRVTHSVPTAFVMNAVGTEWVTPGLPRMSEYNAADVKYLGHNTVRGSQLASEGRYFQTK